MTGIDVTVGHLRQVVPSALRFAVELTAHCTPAEGSTLTIAAVPAAGRCRECRAEGALGGFPFACATYGGLAIEVTAGEELRVESIEVAEA